MAITHKYIDANLETNSQEINIYKLGTEDHWHISTTIPKFARKYKDSLIEGVEVYNKESGQLVELHGTLGNKSVSLNHSREYTENEREALRERMLKLHKTNKLKQHDKKGTDSN